MPVLPLPRYRLLGVKLAELKHVKSTFDPHCMRQITCLTNLLVTHISQTWMRPFRSSMARLRCTAKQFLFVFHPTPAVVKKIMREFNNYPGPMQPLGRRFWLAFWAIAFSNLAASFDATMLSVALPVRFIS